MKILKGALIFLSGVGIGSVGSYIYYKKKLEENREEILEIKEHYFGKIEKIKEQEEYDKKLKECGYISQDEEVITDMIDRVSESAIENSRPPEDNPEEPYIITEKDFSETNLGYEKVEMDYYLDDGALVDEDDELQIVEDILGYDNLDEFIEDEALNSIYIRNDKFGTDYLIHKVAGKYSDIIGLGGDDDD